MAAKCSLTPVKRWRTRCHPIARARHMPTSFGLRAFLSSSGNSVMVASVSKSQGDSIHRMAR